MFHYFHHPFWRYQYFGNTQMTNKSRDPSSWPNDVSSWRLFECLRRFVFLIPVKGGATYLLWVGLHKPRVFFKKKKHQNGENHRFFLHSFSGPSTIQKKREFRCIFKKTITDFPGSIGSSKSGCAELFPGPEQHNLEKLPRCLIRQTEPIRNRRSLWCNCKSL